MYPLEEQLKNKLNKIEKFLEKINFEGKTLERIRFSVGEEEDYENLGEKFNDKGKVVEEYTEDNLKVTVFENANKVSDWQIEHIELALDKSIKESRWSKFVIAADMSQADLDSLDDNEEMFMKTFDDFELEFIDFVDNDTSDENSREDKDTEKSYQQLYEEEKEKRLKALADIQNEKKRLAKQRQEFMKMSNSAMVKDLFEVVDDINRATVNDIDKDSLKMILNKFLGILNNYGIVPLDIKEGDEFDAEIMEAVSVISAGEDKSGKVVHVEQIGFKEKEEDKMIRNSRVIVGK